MRPFGCPLTILNTLDSLGKFDGKSNEGTQDSYVTGSSGKDKGPIQEYILLPLQPHKIMLPMPEDEQVWQDELEMMVTQELKAAQATSTNQLSTDRPFVSADRSFVSTDRSNTPNVSVASTFTGANANESSFVYLGGKIPIDASTLPNADLPIDPNIPDLEDASDTLPNDGIYSMELMMTMKMWVQWLISITWITPLLSVLFLHSEFIRIIQKDKF
ncbi:hypothetical protein Tco_1375544 [Tanacetum coccineum]